MIDSGAIDGRSREGKFILSYQNMLIRHCGGNPSITQRAIINRAARLALHLELFDEKSLKGDHVFTRHDHEHYLWWSNALVRVLKELGLQAPAAPAPRLSDLLAPRSAA